LSESGTIGIVAAFAAGLVSFLSPCVAPLIPGYLALISGNAVVSSGEVARKNSLFFTSLAFVAGFTLVFVSLGASASAFGDLVLADYRQTLTRIAGLVMIIMGFVLLWGFRIPWLMSERRFHFAPRQFSLSETLLVGMAFGLGWTPCFGPILAGILAYTSTVDGVREGTLLLTAYSFGLGLPFLAAGFGLGHFDRLLRFMTRHMRTIALVSGTAMILIGVVFVTGQIFRFSIYGQRFVDQISGVNG
jgi:cytochrome c-type biogenesis protein